MGNTLRTTREPHFFEHFTAKEGFQLMRECYLKLRPGGVFRAALPTYREALDAFVRGDPTWFDLVEEYVPSVVPGTKTMLDYINFGVYQEGQHKSIYDEKGAIFILQSLGYRSVALSSYQEGMDPGDAIHRKYSFYVDAVK